MTNLLTRRLTKIAGVPISDPHAVATNYGITVYRVQSASGDWAVKHDTTHGDGRLAIEARMLGDLGRAGLPAPQVRHSTADLLVMDWVETAPGDTGAQETHAGELLARLHSTPAPRYGYAYDTTIGPLPQPNRQADTWVDFYRDQRLLFMARLARDRGALPGDMYARLKIFAERLETLLAEPAQPSLIHGDVWAGNVLASGGRVAAFIDPALYHADAEVELAYITMLGTFGTRFFEAYNAHRPIDAEFFISRCDIYALYPRLVHVIVCGPAYLAGIDDCLRKFGV